MYKERANYLKRHYLKQLGKTEAELDKKERQRYNYWNKIMPFLYGRFGGFGGIIRWPVSFFRGLSKPMYREVSNNSMRVSAHKSVGLATQTFMLSMAAEGYDTCPMEGFDSKRVKKLLRLPKRAEVNMIISVGKRKPEGIYGERVRVPFNEVYSEI